MVIVACWTRGFRVCTDDAIPPKSEATWGIVFACRPCTSPACTERINDRAALASASRSGAVSCDSVLQVAAFTLGMKKALAQVTTATWAIRSKFRCLVIAAPAVAQDSDRRKLIPPDTNLDADAGPGMKLKLPADILTASPRPISGGRDRKRQTTNSSPRDQAPPLRPPEWACRR